MPTQSEGYYIAPSGDIIPIDTTHIESVLKHPEKFRTTKKELQEIYDKYDEPYGLEGKAREEILSNFIKEGWIRLRYIPRNDMFTAQLDKLNKRKKDWLYGFAKEALEGIKGIKNSPNTEMSIIDLKGNILAHHSLKELSQDVLYKTAKKQKVISFEEYVIPSFKDKIITKVIERLGYGN